MQLLEKGQQDEKCDGQNALLAFLALVEGPRQGQTVIYLDSEMKIFFCSSPFVAVPLSRNAVTPVLYRNNAACVPAAGSLRALFLWKDLLSKLNFQNTLSHFTL